MCKRRAMSETVEEVVRVWGRQSDSRGGCSEVAEAATANISGDLFTFLSNSSKAEQSLRRSCLCGINVNKIKTVTQGSLGFV